ncbi:S-layer protein [Methanoregula sp.]|uniref:COG1361 S-layer family protein n=1 Tax=Methanoregula sp. TaxID=2052170 RepID=UPI002C29B095|nr:S-layer protein [Methanoregula sp.]HVP95611.1 S-layer protein [Methanoregula sp.]
MRSSLVIALLVLAAAVCCMPVLGQDKYLGGSPQITGYINGTNEFSPGEDTTITVTLINSGTAETMYIDQGTLPQPDLPTTAKLVTADLSSGGAPINITSGTQTLGDIASPGTASVSFPAKITADATLGSYTLPLTLHYTYLSNSLANQPASDQVQPVYSPVTVTVPLTIKIKPVVKIDVLDAEATGLAVGTEGYINLTIRNAGYEDGTKASVQILQNGDSAIIPTDDSVYIGDFPRNGTVTCLYKVAVSSAARQQTYPVDVVVTYTDSDGDIMTSAADTVGIPVAGKITFAVVSPPAVITQGSDTVINITYQNTGAVTARAAEARLSTYSPLSSADSLAYLGDIPPGGTATARYALSADGNAAPGTYPLDTEVRYRDLLDNSQVSDTFTANVTIMASRGSGIPGGQTAVAVTLIVLILIGAGYYVFIVRKKR